MKHSRKRETYGDDAIPAGLLPEVVMVGWDRFPVAHASALHSHRHPDAYEICLLLDGTTEWWVEQETHTLHRGDVYIIRPGERHGGIHAVMHPCELFWVQVAPVESLVGELAERLENLPLRVFRGSREELMAAFEILLAEHRAPVGDALRRIAARAALHTLLVTVLRDAEQGKPLPKSHYSPAIEKARIRLENNLAEPLLVEQVASSVGLSAPRLIERFLQEVGETPGEWRLRRRLLAAKTVLQTEPETSITEVAFRFGWSSSQYFATAFKRQEGLSPSDWRKYSKRNEKKL